MTTLLFSPETRWECPNCTLTAVTYIIAPHAKFHMCRGLGGTWVPMVGAGTKCKVTIHEREDYIKDEVVYMTPDCRPVMKAVVTREDGEDCAVFAPAARITSETLELARSHA
mgnify:CR=1 FL=1